MIRFWMSTALAGGWTDVSAGGEVACAVEQGEGRVACWGATGENETVEPPHWIGGLLGIERVEVDGDNLCALTSSGELDCRHPYFYSHVQLDQVVDVEAEKWNTCAVRTDGSLWCWGSPDVVPQAPDSKTPTRLEGVEAVLDVELTRSGGCARGTAGWLWCWGELSTVVQPSASRDTVVGIADVHAYELHVEPDLVCVRAEGDIRCWGGPTPERLPVVAGVPNRQQRCWVTDQILQCVGHGVRSETPRELRAGVTQIALGWVDPYSPNEAHFGCALDQAGEVWCWGDNLYGTLGTVVPLERWMPAEVRGLDDAVDLAVARHNACALRANGEVVCWGSADGLGRPGRADAPAPVTVPGLPPITDLAAHGDLMCALAEDRVLCWPPLWRADPDEGIVEVLRHQDASSLFVTGSAVCVTEVVGVRCAVDAVRFRPVAGVPPVYLRPETVFFRAHTIAIDDQGRICIADPSGVQCGGASPRDRQGVQHWQAPAPVAGLDGADSVLIATSIPGFCTLQRGEPRCWEPGSSVPVRFREGVRGTDLHFPWWGAVGLLVTPEGQVLQLGGWTDNSVTPPYPPPPTQQWTEIPELEGVAQARVGQGFACVRHTDGRVSCWGLAEHGKLGDGLGTWSEVPIRVEPPP